MGRSSLLSGYLPRAPAEDGEDMTHNIMLLDYLLSGRRVFDSGSIRLQKQCFFAKILI